MSITCLHITEYTVICDVCKTKMRYDSQQDSVHNKQQAIRLAGMHMLKNGDVLCSDCFSKNKMVGKMVACNHRNDKSCPHKTDGVCCDVYKPKVKEFGEPLEFYCLRGIPENPRRKKCKMVQI